MSLEKFAACCGHHVKHIFVLVGTTVYHLVGVNILFG